MARDLTSLGQTRPDVLVVGGGLHGLFSAYDAASRGLRVVLVEQDDFGGGLSFNHQRTIHGGLRALETARVSAVRAQIAERRVWAEVAPHLIDPLPFVVGTYRGRRPTRLAVRAGFAVYDMIGWRRNAGVPERLRIPPAALLSRDRLRHLFPGVATDGLTGGAMWHDYQLRHPDRLNWLVALAARRAGATLVNYMAATGPLMADGRIAGMHLRDVIDGHELDVESRMTIVAAGTRLTGLEGPGTSSEPPRLVRAVNVLLDRPAPTVALVAPGSAGRMLTAVPWRGLALVGTFQSDEFVDAEDAGMPTQVLDAILREIGTAFPGLDGDRAAVRLVHHGLTPGVARHGRAELMPASRVLVGGRELPPGVVAIVGAKFTTARQTAEAAVDAVCAALECKVGCRTRDEPLPFAGRLDPVALSQGIRGTGLSAALADHLVDWYGGESPAVAEWAASRGVPEPLADTTAVLAGEVSYAVEHAQALRLADVVLRRTALGETGHPGPRALDRAATEMANVLGWSEARRQDEIRQVERRFA